MDFGTVCNCPVRALADRMLMLRPHPPRLDGIRKLRRISDLRLIRVHTPSKTWKSQGKSSEDSTEASQARVKHSHVRSASLSLPHLSPDFFAYNLRQIFLRSKTQTTQIAFNYLCSFLFSYHNSVFENVFFHLQLFWEKSSKKVRRRVKNRCSVR